MKTINEKDQPLLNRKSYVIEVPHEESKTPNKTDLQKKISEFLKVKPELLKINSVFTYFGKGISKANVEVYNSEKDMKFLEIKKKKKNGKKESKKQNTK